MNPDKPDIEVVASATNFREGDILDVRCDVRGVARGYQVTWSRVGYSDLGDNVIARGNMIRLHSSLYLHTFCQIVIQFNHVRFNNISRRNVGLYRCTVRTPQGTPYADYNLSWEGIGADY